jgi:hypothetical protein
MNSQYFYSWIPSVASEETFSFSFRCFINEKIIKNQCYIELERGKDGREKIFCDLIPKKYRPAIPKYISYLLKNLNIDEKCNSLLIYPKYLNYKNGRYQDNTIILISNRPKGVQNIDYVLIFDDNFFNFIKKIYFESSKKQSDYSSIYYRGSKISDWDRGFFKLELICHGEKCLEGNQCVGRQIYRILCDIYHLKSFHKDQSMLLDLIPADCETEAKETIIKMYNDKIAFLHKAMTIYSNSPFYYFINFLYVRMIQNFIKLANGEIQFAKNFVFQFKEDEKERKKWLHKFDFAKESLSIPSARIESRWRFVTSLGLMVSVFAFFTSFFSNNLSLFGVILPNWVSEPVFLILLFLFAIVVGQIFVSFTILLFVDFFEKLLGYLKKKRIKWQIKYGLPLYAILQK